MGLNGAPDSRLGWRFPDTVAGPQPQQGEHDDTCLCSQRDASFVNLYDIPSACQKIVLARRLAVSQESLAAQAWFWLR